MKPKKNTLSILFYLRRGQINKNGECSIMCRMSVRGERETFTTRVFTKPEDWEAKSQRILGRTAKVQEQNRFLEKTEALIGIQKSKKTYEKYERCEVSIIKLRSRLKVDRLRFTVET